MKKIWKILGTIGSFLIGLIFGGMFMSSMLNSPYLTFITNDRELIIGFAILMGLIVVWWYNTTTPIK